MDELQEFLEKIKQIGPRRVKTKDVEIDAQDPEKIQKLLERIEKKPVHLSDFQTSKVEYEEDQCDS